MIPHDTFAPSNQKGATAVVPVENSTTLKKLFATTLARLLVPDDKKFARSGL